MIHPPHPYPAYKPSGVEWLGDVPTHWELVPSRAVFTEINERDHPDEQMLSVTIARGVIRQKILLQDSSQKDSSRLDKSAYKLVCPGDLAYNKMRAWQGAFGVSTYRGIVSPAYVVQRPRNGANALYFHHLLRTPAFAAEAERWSYGIASDMWSLRPEHFKMMYVPLPPLPEQAAIVRYLDHVDRRVRRYVSAKRRLIALLEEERKFATLEAMQSHSAISRRVEVVAELVQRPIKRASDDTYTPIGLYNRGRGMFRKEPRCGNDLGDSNFFWIEKGDLVISGQFAWEGAIAMASDVEHGCVASHRYPILRGKPGILDSGFLLGFFQTDWGQLLLDHNSRGAAGRNRPLNARALMKERISLPPIEAQLRIAGMLQVESQVRQQARRSEQLLHEYRTRLTADVVTGKLDVREAAAQLPDETDDQDPIEESGPLADGMDEALYDIDESAEELAIESEVSA